MLVGLTRDEMGQIRESLVGEAALPSNPVGFGDAVSAVERAQPELVIVSFSQGSEAPLAIAPALLRERPECVLVALSDTSQAETILAAMRVGYKEFVVLPSDLPRLRQVVHDAAYTMESDEDAGLVISFVGAKGGVGTSMLTANAGAELAGLNKVLAIDLDMSMGDLTSVLNLQPTEDITSLLSRSSRLDERLLVSAAVIHSSKLHVLAQPGDPGMKVEYTPDDIYAVINVAARAYQYVVIDCGPHIDDATTLAISVSDLIVLVTEPTVISVRDAFRRIRHLSGLGVEADRLRLVVNRHHRDAYVSTKDIQANLGLPIAATISDDPVVIGQALDEGKLVRDTNRKSQVSKDISGLLSILTDDGEEPAEEKAAQSGSFLFGLFGRG
ncbi:MAG: hypothetical protein EA397_20120 [Deltaproteobacteria bacterium]|nr:MAG: hypothetical protein EA397_20120 [Deltaproteobacteria bacterium]